MLSGIAEELRNLQFLSGTDFVVQLKKIVACNEFYHPGSLARSIKRYFENSSTSLEVLVFKGRKTVSITRDLTLSPNYYQLFMKRYMK